MNDDPGSLGIASPTSAVLTLRVLWGALLLGQVSLVVVILAMGEQRFQTDKMKDFVQGLFWLSWAFLAIVVPAGYFLRNQIYKRYWREQAIEPGAYVIGNLLLLTMLEGMALFGWILALLGGRFLPTALPSFVAMGVQVINFPTGAPLRPAPFDGSQPSEP